MKGCGRIHPETKAKPTQFIFGPGRPHERQVSKIRSLRWGIDWAQLKNERKSSRKITCFAWKFFCLCTDYAAESSETAVCLFLGSPLFSRVLPFLGAAAVVSATTVQSRNMMSCASTAQEARVREREWGRDPGVLLSFYRAHFRKWMKITACRQQVFALVSN